MYSIDICQKEPPEVFCEKRCSEKFRKIHRKAPVLKPQASKFVKKETATQVFPGFLRKIPGKSSSEANLKFSGAFIGYKMGTCA